MDKNRQVLIDLLAPPCFHGGVDQKIVVPILLRATAMLMSLGIIKHMTFVTRLSVIQCKQSFGSVHDKKFENNWQCIIDTTEEKEFKRPRFY